MIDLEGESAGNPNCNHATDPPGFGRRTAKFKQADVTRAIKGAQKAKVQIACVKIGPDGTIALIPGQPSDMSQSPSHNPWDDQP